MAELIVQDLEDVNDIVELVSFLTRRLAHDDAGSILTPGTHVLSKSPYPSPEFVGDMVRMWEDGDEFCPDPWHRDECSCVADAALTDPRQGVLFDIERNEGPVRFLPCPRRGQHERLTDCWMCWCDVEQCHITEAEALAPTAVVAGLEGVDR